MVIWIMESVLSQYFHRNMTPQKNYQGVKIKPVQCLWNEAFKRNILGTLNHNASTVIVCKLTIVMYIIKGISCSYAR